MPVNCRLKNHKSLLKQAKEKLIGSAKHITYSPNASTKKDPKGMLSSDMCDAPTPCSDFDDQAGGGNRTRVISLEG